MGNDTQAIKQNAPSRLVSRLYAGMQTERGADWLAAALCLLWLVPGIWGRGAWKPDEAYTLGIIYDFLHGHSWWIPTLGGSPFMEKPPLYFWTAAVFSRLLAGWLPFDQAARFATLLYSLVTLLATWAAARELYGRRLARLAPLALAACLGLVYREHELLTDSGLLAGFALAAWGMALAWRRPVAGGVALGFGTGVGFLCKGLLAPGVLGIAFLLLPWLAPAYRRRGWWLTAGVAFLIALPLLAIWPWEVYRRSPSLFRDWLWVNNFGRFLHGDNMGGEYDPYYYLKALPLLALPALPLAAHAVWQQRKRWRSPPIALPLLLAVVLYAVLQLSHAVSDVYVLPLFLPLAWLAALGVSELPAGWARVFNLTAWLLFGVLAALLWWGWTVWLSGAPPSVLASLHRLLPRGVMRFETPALAVALLYTLAWLLLPLAAKPPAERALIRWVGGLSLVWCLAMTLWLPALNSSKSYRRLMEQIAAVMPRPHQCVASYGVGDSERALLDYEADVPTQPFYAPSALPKCDLLLVQTAGRRTPPFSGWVALWHGERPEDGGEHFWLLARPRARLFAKLAGRPTPAYPLKPRQRGLPE